MAGLGLDLFERQAETYLAARQWREWMYLSGQRPGRGLVSLYDEDFPDLTSRDLWADLQAATPEDPRQLRRLSELLASASIEGRTRETSVQLTRAQVAAEVVLGDERLAWRDAPARWPLLGDVPRRHGLATDWRRTWQSELRPTLERQHETLRAALQPLSNRDWWSFWTDLKGLDPGQPGTLSDALLTSTEELYVHGLSIFFGGLGLPLDDAWEVDADWAFRAARFDAVFPEHARIPLLIRTLGDLGIELIEQTAVVRDQTWTEPGVRIVATDVPREVHVLQRLIGGWQDVAHSLVGLGMAQHVAHTDASLRLWERWLGDPSPTLAYGRLLEGLLRDRMWLVARADYGAHDDFLAIAHLARLYRVRRLAALSRYEERVWSDEPGAALAGDYEDTLTAATRVRHFGDEYLSVLIGAPWSTLQPAIELRAELFAAHLAAFLRREFDEEWWRSPRAARFLVDELWRPGRRHSAEELLGFMGFEGFDPSLLVAECEEVLRPL